MRNFIGGYCEARFGTDWHLSPEPSLLLLSGERALPLQLQIWTKTGHNQLVLLPHGCISFLLLRSVEIGGITRAARSPLNKAKARFKREAY